MSEKREIFFVKLITLIIFLLLLFQIKAYSGQFKHEKIVSLFLRYNNKISRERAYTLSQIVLREAHKHNINPYIIAAIIVRESSVRTRAISKTGDYGLMQIHLKAHRKKIRNVEDLFNPEINIALGTQIFADCLKHSKSLRSALIRYSGGNKTMANRVLRTLRELEQ